MGRGWACNVSYLPSGPNPLRGWFASDLAGAGQSGPIVWLGLSSEQGVKCHLKEISRWQHVSAGNSASHAGPTALARGISKGLDCLSCHTEKKCTDWTKARGGWIQWFHLLPVVFVPFSFCCTFYTRLAFFMLMKNQGLNCTFKKYNLWQLTLFAWLLFRMIYWCP